MEINENNEIKEKIEEKDENSSQKIEEKESENSQEEVKIEESEEEIEERIEQRKQKVKNWLKDPHNLVLLGILIFAFAIGLYYFNITKSQPLWWDEAEYMSAAKNYAGILEYELGSQRLPGYPVFLSIFFILGITSESSIRFIALLIPSLITIFLMYLCMKEMYPDKKIALISTFIFAVFWQYLFYSNRFHTENPSLIFELLVIIVLFRCYLKNQNWGFVKPKYSLLWIALFTILSILLRPGSLMFVLPLFLFIIILNKSKIFRKKRLIIYGILILIFIFLSVFLLKFSDQPFLKSGLLTYYNPQNPLAWNTMGVFYIFYQSTVPIIPSILFYAFIFGFLLVFLDIALSFEKIKKIAKNQEGMGFKSDLFNLLLIVTTMVLFIFVIRPPPGPYEPRWFFPLIIGVFAFTSKGLIRASSYLGNLIKNEKSKTVLLIFFLLIGAYTQLVHTDTITKAKIDSYLPVKQAGLWIKDNSDKDDIIFSSSLPQNTYYSERATYSYPENESKFFEMLKEKRPRYMVISVFEPNQPAWIFNFSEKYKNLINPVNAWFADAERKQSVLVIYEFNQNLNID